MFPRAFHLDLEHIDALHGAPRTGIMNSRSHPTHLRRSLSSPGGLRHRLGLRRNRTLAKDKRTGKNFMPPLQPTHSAKSTCFPSQIRMQPRRHPDTVNRLPSPRLTIRVLPTGAAPSPTHG